MKEHTFFRFWLGVSLIEGIVTFCETLNFQADPKNVFLFGFSTSRLFILLFLLICILCIITLFFYENKIQESFTTRFNSIKEYRFLAAVGILSLTFLYVTLFIPTKYFSSYEALFVRLKPALIWLELLTLQFVIWIKTLKKSFGALNKNTHIDRVVLIFTLIPLLVIWLFISISKVGLVFSTAFWNVPGIPIDMIQFIGILLFLCMGLIFSTRGNSTHSSNKFVNILIPIVIYIATVLIWGSTPLLRDATSLEPTPPNLQPYPLRDARVHDIGGLSIVMGKGVNFHGYTDKPLYMLFLAALHIFTRNDYNLLQWAQILMLAFTPVVLFLIGKKYFGAIFGIITAVMLIVQQRNAIALSYKVSSVNPKLLLSENLTLLGMIAITYFLFRWMKIPDERRIFLLGGLIGAFSLVRINPIFIAPVIALIIALKFWKSPRSLFKQMAFFGAGFILVFSPWLFTGVNSEGKSWFFLKIKDVIENRYAPQVEAISSQTLETLNKSTFYQDNQYPIRSDTSNSIDQKDLVLSPLTSDGKTATLVWLMFNHYLHNFSTSLLALPDSVTVYNLNDLSAREYLQDENQWDGNFPASQSVLILMNLLIIGAGIACGWKKHGWAGLVPLFIFLVYNLSLSAALNSGSRYIVPINWIIFFYYALGLILIAQLVFNFLGLKTELGFIESKAPEPATQSISKKAWLPVVSVMVILSLLLLIANLVVPRLVTSEKSFIALRDFAKSNKSTDNQMNVGNILYPYYQKDGSLSFDFLVGSTTTSFLISQNHIVSSHPVILQSGMPALLEVSYNDAKNEIKSMYLMGENSPQLFWHTD